MSIRLNTIEIFNDRNSRTRGKFIFYAFNIKPT